MTRLWWLALLLLTTAAGDPRPVLMTYYESWLDPGLARLATLPGSVDIVALAFARPDLHYAGDLRLGPTGLQFADDGGALRAAVAALRRRNPATRVLLAVGGSGYGRWERLDADAVGRLVRDLGLDGVDVDFEPTQPACENGACASDAQWVDIVTRLRAAMPRPALLTVPGWSVGAYGEGPWRNAEPRSPWTGSMLHLLHAPAGRLIDLLSVMAYEAGPRFDPGQALAAYNAAWTGPVLLGASVADGAGWLARVPSPAGVMLYGWLATPPPGQPDAAEIAAALARRQPRQGD